MSIFKKFAPEPIEYGNFYSGYLDPVKGLSIAEAWKKDKERWESLFDVLRDDGIHFAYAEGKWSISRVLLHCFDAERIFAIRALRLIRGESGHLTGYDQDVYADQSPAEQQSVDDLRFQWNATRNLTESVFMHAKEESLRRIGNSSGHPISARALGLIIPGHNLHHLGILKTRYGLDF